jgi:hypothetical protein
MHSYMLLPAIGSTSRSIGSLESHAMHSGCRGCGVRDSSSWGSWSGEGAMCNGNASEVTDINLSIIAAGKF